MFLSSLHLQNFRSYSDRTFQFTKNTTVFVGPNAIGKTNILEAIVLLSLTKGFRSSKDEDLIALEADFCRVKAQVEEDLLEVVLTRGLIENQRVAKKRLVVNGAGKRTKDFLGKVRTVLFEPQDLLLIIGSPGRRREYLDFVLTQIDWQYAQSLMTYQKGLRQRNRLLFMIGNGHDTVSQLEFWNDLLIKHAAVLQAHRSEYIEFLSSHNDFGIQLNYHPNVIDKERLEHYHQAELGSHTTLIGPHRDDFEIKLKVQSEKFKVEEEAEGRNLAHYGSRGEQRMAVLAMKLAELEFITTKTGERPLLLLDDIFSELDTAHRDQVLSIIDQQQTFITTADLEFMEERHLKEVDVVELG